MATIPVGNFGNRIADAGAAPRAIQGDPIGDAAQGAIQTGQAIIGRQQAEQKQRDEQSQRATAALALAKVNNALHDAHDEAATGISDGSLPIDDVGPFMEKRTAAIRKDFTSTLTPEQRGMVDDNIETTAGGLSRSLNGIINKRKQSETAATVDQFGEQVARDGMRKGPGWASEKFDAMVDFTAGAAGWSPEVAGRKKQAFREASHYAFFDAAGTGAFVKGDVEAIQKVRDQMAGDTGESMDPVKRTTLDHQLFGYQQNILAKQARAANAADEEARKRHNEAVDVYNQGIDLAMSGAQFSPDFIKDMTTKAEGTEMAPAVLELISKQADISGFATKPASDRAAMLNAYRADRATPGVGIDPASQKMLTAMETMDGKLRQQFNDNPWEAAQSAGVIRDAGEIQPGNPSETISTIQNRMQTIGRIEAWGGKKVSPLQPREVDLVGKMVRAMPVDQAASMLARIGSGVGDAERVAALAKQMGDKDGTLGLAMMYANSQTTQNRYTAELVLRGEQAIKDKLVKPDEAKETGWRAEIAKQVRGAYSNREVEDAAVNAAFLVLAARTADGSQGDVNVDNAVRLATGGITERNGAKIPLPSGMSESDFDKKIKAVTPADIVPQLNTAPNFGKGNIDLSKRPVVRNKDGSISTVRSMSANIDGTETLLPTVSESGQVMTDQQAIEQYRRTGKHLGKFSTPQEATAYAQDLHRQQEQQYSGAGAVVFSGLKPIPLADFVASLPSAQLVHAGQGRYNVRTGSSLITNAQGQRITIKVNP